MQKYTLAALTAATLILGGCGSDSNDDGSTSTDPLELESDGKTLIFYSASTNEHYAFDVDSETTTNLNGATDAKGEDLTNFNMAASDQGRLFVWMDDKGDDDASNDEGKVIMFTQDYQYAQDGNATWEDFYYLGHYHSETDGNNVTEHHLAAHANEEFDVTSGAKYNAMIRLNKYLAAQETLKNTLAALLPAEANGLCAFHTFVSEEDEAFYYAMGTNGTVYIYDAAETLQDSVAVASSCEANAVGMSSTKDGLLLLLNDTQKVYSIDSHEDGIFHVHNSWELSRLIGSGHSAQMMVGIEPLVSE